jgi:hypothetical protein
MITTRTTLGVDRGVTLPLGSTGFGELGCTLTGAKTVDLSSEQFSHQKAVLDLMDLYMSLFRVESGSEFARSKGFGGPFDIMARLPEGSSYFDFDDQYPRYMALKKELLANERKRNIVFQNDGSHNDFWIALAESLPHHCPGYFSCDQAPNTFTNNITGEEWKLNQCDPFLAVVSSVQEDLILLERNKGGSPKISNISVFFPSRWNPAGAAGRSVRDVHQIVPKFEIAGLSDKIDRILNNLDKPGVRFTRLIHPYPILHQSTDIEIPKFPAGVNYTEGNVEDKLYMRVEKQRFFSGDTLTGDARHKDLILMSIKTYVLPLRVIEASQGFAQKMWELHEAIRNEPTDPNDPLNVFREYRGGTTAFLEPLIDYLDRVRKVQLQNPLEHIKRFGIPDDAYSCFLVS